MKWRHCSGTMSGGTRKCYFRGVVQLRGRWFCRKCYRMRTTVPDDDPPPPKKPDPKRLSEKDLNTLYVNVMKCKREGAIDAHSAKEIALNILPMVLEEIYQLRDLPKPDTK